MNKYKQSFSWWNLQNAPVSPAALIAASARLGYDGIEMPDREHWPRIVDSGLTIASDDQRL
jgi:sugar phosphate isomerase/epimerase